MQVGSLGVEASAHAGLVYAERDECTDRRNEAEGGILCSGAKLQWYGFSQGF